MQTLSIFRFSETIINTHEWSLELRSSTYLYNESNIYRYIQLFFAVSIVTYQQIYKQIIIILMVLNNTITAAYYVEWKLYLPITFI